MSPTSPPREAIQIRDARLDDVTLMARWAEAMALESEQTILDAGLVLGGIRRALEDPARGRYFMAEIAGQPVGTLMITYEWSDWRDAWWWWIQSVYVDIGQRRRGVLSALYRHVHALAAADEEVCGLRLYVERENAAALRTYEYLGMQDTGYRMYEAVTRQRTHFDDES